MFKNPIATIPPGSTISGTVHASSHWVEVTYRGRTGWVDAKFLKLLHAAEPSEGATVSVDKFEPNDFGLYNVHGNVWEWVQDCWHDDYKGAPSDGSAWVLDSDCSARVLRSGSWAQPSKHTRSAYRDKGGMTSAGNNETGFRVAKTLP
jgi:formylglycine-generating enzyme required for sulfatase activity